MSPGASRHRSRSAMVSWWGKMWAFIGGFVFVAAIAAIVIRAVAVPAALIVSECSLDR